MERTKESAPKQRLFWRGAAALTVAFTMANGIPAAQAETPPTVHKCGIEIGKKSLLKWMRILHIETDSGGVDLGVVDQGSKHYAGQGDVAVLRKAKDLHCKETSRGLTISVHDLEPKVYSSKALASGKQKYDPGAISDALEDEAKDKGIMEDAEDCLVSKLVTAAQGHYAQVTLEIEDPSKERTIDVGAPAALDPQACYIETFKRVS